MVQQSRNLSSTSRARNLLSWHLQIDSRCWGRKATAFNVCSQEQAYQLDVTKKVNVSATSLALINLTSSILFESTWSSVRNIKIYKKTSWRTTSRDVWRMQTYQTLHGTSAYHSMQLSIARFHQRQRDLSSPEHQCQWWSPQHIIQQRVQRLHREPICHHLTEM